MINTCKDALNSQPCVLHNSEILKYRLFGCPQKDGQYGVTISRRNELYSNYSPLKSDRISDANL